MSAEKRTRLIEEAMRKIDEFLGSDEISEERKTAVLRELLEIAFEEQ